jgi:hypothetical protein
MAQRWLILGTGGHGSSVAAAITAGCDQVVGALDDALPAGSLVNGKGCPVSTPPWPARLSRAWRIARLW